MKASEIKKLMIEALGNDHDEATKLINSEVVSYDFRNGFKGRVLEKLFSEETKLTREIEFSRFLSIAFSRIALTGVAAIVILLLSLFLSEGSLSFNAILGLTDLQNEDMVLLLTGN
ncbi:MAG TPA: hypothetical protein VK213_11615 [Bacteroidales bacterium]|nr:hypothetical protein [Bacteroidales bacterium]